MMNDKVKLPGSEDETNEEIMDLIDQAREEDKFLVIKAEGTISKEQKVYVTKMYDLGEESENDEMFYMKGEDGLRHHFLSPMVLHDFMLEQKEAEIVDLEDLPENQDSHDTNWRKTLKSWQEKENPFQSVYVFVKHTDDGRYKDEWKLYRGKSEAEIRERKGLARPELGEDKYVYHCIGAFGVVKEHKEELKGEYDFDLKQSGGRSIPTDLRALTDEDEIHDTVEEVLADE